LWLAYQRVVQNEHTGVAAVRATVRPAPTRIPPSAATIRGTAPSSLRVQSQCAQVALPGSGSLPLPPQPPPHPVVE